MSRVAIVTDSASDMDPARAEALGITNEDFRDVRKDVAPELEPLLVGAQGEQRECGAQALAQAELNRVKVEPSGFDLGEIQYVVYQQQK